MVRAGYAVLGMEGQPSLFDAADDRGKAQLVAVESFEGGVRTPAIGSTESLSHTLDHDELRALRDSGIRPRFLSDISGSDPYFDEFTTGAHMMGMLSNGKTLKPQQVLTASACSAASPGGLPLWRFMAVLEPRRSTKTTTLIAMALGRCATREGYLVGYTVCTTGLKARDRFHKDIVPPLEKRWKDPKTRPFDIRKSGGSERIVFPNGSIFQVLPPDGDAFRSDAYDLVIFDEAGKATPEMTLDLIAGAAATLDTRPDGQLIVAGTAPKFRKGNLLWDALERGRTGVARNGIIDYSVPDTTTEEELADWEPSPEHPNARVRELVEQSHPGVGTLTTIDDIYLNFTIMTPEDFAMEYLGIAGNTGAETGIVDMAKWEANKKTGKLPEPPERFSLVIAAHPDQISSCIVAVWRVRRRVKVLVLDHRRGVDWLADEATRLSRKYHTPIIHDTNGPITAVVEAIARKRPKPRLLGQTFPQVKTAAALLINEIDAGRVDHWDQEELTNAARLTKKRSVGPTAWALGRNPKSPGDDIAPMEAAAMGLRVYDDRANRAPIRGSVS